MLQKVFTGLIVLLFATAAAASDATLTEDQAKRFVASLDDVDVLSDEWRDTDKIKNIEFEMKPKPGEPFQPYTTGVTALKDAYPADYSKLTNIVKKHGFKTAEWSSTGDRVMAAYLAITMDKDMAASMKQMEAMDPNMLAMMPPEVKAQMEGVKAMLEAINASPEADRKAVAAVKDDLDAYMDRQAKKAE